MRGAIDGRDRAGGETGSRTTLISGPA